MHWIIVVAIGVTVPDIFDPIPIKPKVPSSNLAGPLCIECGKNPVELFERCRVCFDEWALQIMAVQRAMR